MSKSRNYQRSRNCNWDRYQAKVVDNRRIRHTVTHNIVCEYFVEGYIINGMVVTFREMLQPEIEEVQVVFKHTMW